MKTLNFTLSFRVKWEAWNNFLVAKEDDVPAHWKVKEADGRIFDNATSDFAAPSQRKRTSTKEAPKRCEEGTPPRDAWVVLADEHKDAYNQTMQPVRM